MGQGDEHRSLRPPETPDEPADAVAAAPAEWGSFHPGTPLLGPTVGVGTGIPVEAVLTCFLAFVAYGTGIDPKGSFNAVGSFAISLTIAMDIMMVGPLAGAAMNPALWFGPALASGFFDNWWVYWAGPLLGGILGAVAYEYVFRPKAVITSA